MSPYNQTITIQAPVEWCYQMWMFNQMLPKLICQLFSLGHGLIRSQAWQWVVRKLFGSPEQWKLKFDFILPNEVIAWHSEESASTVLMGSVNFYRLTDDTTQVVLKLSYVPPSGYVGRSLSGKVFPWALGDRMLHQFKQDVEQAYQKQKPSMPVVPALVPVAQDVFR